MSDAYGQQAVCRCGQNDLTAFCLFGLGVGDKLGVERDVVDLEGHLAGQLLLEMRLALEEPEHEGKQAERVLLEIGENRLVQQIGADQGVVEIENEREKARSGFPVGTGLFDRNS